MLTLGKLLYGKYKGKKTTLGTFIEVLALAPNTVLNTELVSTLIDYFYEENLQTILTNCFIPFSVYFVSTICFITYFMMRTEAQSQSIHDWTVFEVLNFLLTLGGTAYFVSIEVR